MQSEDIAEIYGDKQLYNTTPSTYLFVVDFTFSLFGVLISLSRTLATSPADFVGVQTYLWPLSVTTNGPMRFIPKISICINYNTINLVHLINKSIIIMV